MQPFLLNMVWPALFVAETFKDFWFLVIGTIFIELFTIKYFLKFSWTKSFIISIIGNICSGIVGTFIMMWGMVFWHLIIDRLTQSTFANINWVATYILMCLGSVFLEAQIIKIIYKEKIKSLFPPMLIGNLLSYVFIAIVMITKTDKDPDEVKVETLKYIPDKQEFILLDSTKMKIDTCKIMVSYDKHGRRLNDTKLNGYSLLIPFTKENEDGFQFNLRVLGEEYGGGITKNSKSFHFMTLESEYRILLEQKNPDTTFGWTKPIITDTLVFKQIKTQM